MDQRPTGWLVGDGERVLKMPSCSSCDYSQSPLQAYLTGRALAEQQDVPEDLQT